jgi:hypothetical protein
MSKPALVSKVKQLPFQIAKTGQMPRARRLLIVQLGVAAGKSNRAIARDVGCDEGTVRNDRKTLSLPAEQIGAVMRGLPVAPLMRKQQAHEAATARHRQEAAEKDSLFLTNRLAKLMEDWLNGFSLIPHDKLHIVRPIDRFSWFYTSNGEASVNDAQIKAAIERAKPTPQQPKEVFALIEWLKVWLFRWLVKVEPNRDIRDRALTRFIQALEGQYTGW